VSRRSKLHAIFLRLFMFYFAEILFLFYYTVISTLVIATIPDPHAAAREVHRVLKPDGRLRFFEHLRSGQPLLVAL
jgi:SAM-dependent methyltransferase